MSVVLSSSVAPASIQTQQRFKPWLVCLTASLFFFYEFLQLMMFNALDPYLLKEFKISATQLGNLSAYYFYANIIMLFPAGMIIDRVSTRLLISIAMTASILSTLLFSQTHSLGLAQLSRFITGIAGSFCFLSCMRLTSRWFPPKKMAMAIGFVVTMAFLGGTAAQTPMTLLTDHLGWRNALLIDALFGFIMLIFIIAIVRDAPNSENISHQKAPSLGFWESLVKSIGNAQNWFAGMYTSLMNLPIFLLGAMWGGLFLVQIHHLTRAQASLVTSMIFIGTIFGSPAIGWISDRFARRKMPMIICAVISLAIVIFINYSPVLTMPMGMVLFFLLGFITSAQIISYPLIAEANPRALTATAGGIASTLIMAGGISQPFFGWLMTLNWNHLMSNDIPVYSLSDYRLALLIMPIGFILSLIFAFLIKETYCVARD